MVKIKVKKEMNLPELVQWGWDNEIENKYFFTSDGNEVHFEQEGRFNTEGYIAFNETFEVEVEEEITEDTIIPNLILIYKYSFSGETNSILYENCSIKNVLCEIESISPLAFCMLNDDMTMTLLWKDGEMAE